MASNTVVVDPATRFVRSLPGNYFLLREAAEAVGVSQFTLRKFISEDIEGLVPSKYAMMGKVKIYLYTREDIENIRLHLKEREVVFNHDGKAKRTGRPATYTKEQRAKRSRMYSNAWYWKNRAKILEERGDHEAAIKAQAKADKIERQLHGNKG